MSYELSAPTAVHMRRLTEAKAQQAKAIAAFNVFHSEHGDVPETKAFEQEHVDPAFERVTEIERAIVFSPAQTPADILAKVVANFTPGLLSDWDGMIAAEAQALLADCDTSATTDANKATEVRLARFATITGTEAPDTILSADGGPSKELLDYCNTHGLSLDWLFCGDIRAFARAAYQQAHIAFKEQRDMIDNLTMKDMLIIRDTLTELCGHGDLTVNGADVAYNLLAHFEDFMQERPAQNEVELAVKVLATFERDGHATNCHLFESLIADAQNLAGIAA